ncbi:MAG TPA: ATP-binding protein, partial [Anaerolineales bacterium]
SELESLSTDIKNVLGNLRATAKALRPPTISSFGLEKAIRSNAEDFREKHPDIRLQLSLAQDGQILPEETRLALFRIVQQSLGNIARHADASEVQIRFTLDAEEAIVEVKDNGRGFVVPSSWIGLVREGHYGLAGAAERVHALSGIFTVQSEPGKFTLVRAVIPWQAGSNQSTALPS